MHAVTFVQFHPFMIDSSRQNAPGTRFGGYRGAKWRERPQREKPSQGDDIASVILALCSSHLLLARAERDPPASRSRNIKRCS